MNSPPQPPKLADRFLAWFCKPELLEEIQGDLHADYERNCKTNGEWIANRYWIQVLNFIWAGLGTLIIALITVSWQSVKAALMNPVNSLRSE